jgi:Cys-rich protein (TIGR01571 family)
MESMAETPTTTSLLANDEFLIDDPSRRNNGGGNDTHTTPSPTAQNMHPVVQVVAPENLTGGFTFDVEVNHEILTVTVPMGGVFKGQTFKSQTQARIVESNQQLRVPMGGWKDGLFDFLKYGPFHSSFCLAICCPLVALGQVYTRLGLSWNGAPSDAPNSTRAFKIMVAISLLCTLVFRLTDGAGVHLISILFLIFTAALAGRTRAYMRSRYDIPADSVNNTLMSSAEERMGCHDCHDNSPQCYAVEDYVTACICQPCVISQMSRHTALYDTYEGTCFSSNGLPNHAPQMVV